MTRREARYYLDRKSAPFDRSFSTISSLWRRKSQKCLGMFGPTVISEDAEPHSVPCRESRAVRWPTLVECRESLRLIQRYQYN